MDLCMYLFLNQGIGMSTGKAAAQVAHAAVEAYRLSEFGLTEAWRDRGYKKIVLACRDEAHMLNTAIYLDEKGYEVAPIIDEGHTEVPPHSFTAMGVPVLDKDDDVHRTVFGEFGLYRDPPSRSSRVILYGRRGRKGN